MAVERQLSLQLMATGQHLTVRAVSPQGEAKGEAALPPSDFLVPLLPATGAVSVPTLKNVGDVLTGALLPGEVSSLARNLLADAHTDGQPVRFELRFDADQLWLAQFPWELIIRDNAFLVRDGAVDITRYINYPQKPPTFEAAVGDRCLLNIAAQRDNLPHSLPPTCAWSGWKTCNRPHWSN